MPMRAVFDSNVFVSALGTTSSICGKLFNHFQDGIVEVVVSRYILSETGRILIEKFKINPSFVYAHLRLFESTMIIVDPIIIPIESIEVNDWPIIGTALAGATELLVTGDQRLLHLKQYNFVHIISPRIFLGELEKGL